MCPPSHSAGHKNYLGQIVIKPFCRQTSPTNALSLEAFILLHGRFRRQCPINTSEMANFLLLRPDLDKIHSGDSAVFCIRSRGAAIPIPIEGEQAAAQKPSRERVTMATDVVLARFLECDKKRGISDVGFPVAMPETNRTKVGLLFHFFAPTSVTTSEKSFFT